MASKVYFADLRADVHENLQQKLTRLMKTAGMGDIDFGISSWPSSCTSVSRETWRSCAPIGRGPWRIL